MHYVAHVHTYTHLPLSCPLAQLPKSPLLIRESGLISLVFPYSEEFSISCRLGDITVQSLLQNLYKGTKADSDQPLRNPTVLTLFLLNKCAFLPTHFAPCL